MHFFLLNKQTYREFLKQVFQKLVDLTAPLCAEMDAAKAQTLIFDTTGIEARVFENNPKFFNGKLSQAKSFAKKNFDVYNIHYTT
jgi:hypothetical protein